MRANSRHVAILLAVVIAAVVAAAVFGSAAKDKRLDSPSAKRAGPHRPIALVIGNGDYRIFPLENPTNDAKAFASALNESGFDVVERENLTQSQIRQVLREFGDRMERGGTALFYYSGHAVQVKGRNYLVPVGADIRHEDEVEDQAIEISLVLNKMENARNQFNIVILDACRNNPFAKTFRSVSQGLAPIDAPPGTLIAFSTAPGRAADDGTHGLGLYTRHLLSNLQTPGLKIEEVFKLTRSAVRRDSDDQQVPWENTSLEGDFYFRPPASMAATPPLPDKPAPVAELPLITKIDETALKRVGDPPAAPPEAKASVARTQAPLSSTMDPPQKVALASVSPQQPSSVGSRSIESTSLSEMHMAFIRKEYELAAQLARPIAARGITDAQFQLGIQYAEGLGVQSNIEESLKWLTSAANQGHVRAQEHLGKLYGTGLGVQRNYPEALKWYRKAANQGSANAQNSLGSMYRSGLGVPQNNGEALHWFALAAAQGNAEAHYNLRLMEPVR